MSCLFKKKFSTKSIKLVMHSKAVIRSRAKHPHKHTCSHALKHTHTPLKDGEEQARILAFCLNGFRHWQQTSACSPTDQRETERERELARGVRVGCTTLPTKPQAILFITLTHWAHSHICINIHTQPPPLTNLLQHAFTHIHTHIQYIDIHTNLLQPLIRTHTPTHTHSSSCHPSPYRPPSWT